MPETTSPKIVYWPCSDGWSRMQTKNCLPPLSLLEGRRAAATVPRANGPVGELGREQAEAARPVLRGLRRVLRERVAALDDPARDDAVERRAVVAAGLRGLDEERGVLRRDLGQQPDREPALGRLDDGLGPGRHGRRPRPRWPASAPPWSARARSTTQQWRSAQGGRSHNGLLSNRSNSPTRRTQARPRTDDELTALERAEERSGHISTTHRQGHRCRCPIEICPTTPPTPRPRSGARAPPCGAAPRRGCRATRRRRPRPRTTRRRRANAAASSESPVSW